MRYAVAILLLAIVLVPAIAEPIDPQDIRVVDGDTIRVQSYLAKIAKIEWRPTNVILP